MNEKQGGTVYCYVLDWDVENVWEFIISLKRPEWSNRTYVLTRQQQKKKIDRTRPATATAAAAVAQQRNRGSSTKDTALIILLLFIKQEKVDVVQWDEALDGTGLKQDHG